MADETKTTSANGEHRPPEAPVPVPVTIVVAPAPQGSMKVSEPLPVKEVPKTSREAAIQWLSQQGVSTVLLFTIVALLAFGVPWYVIPVIQGGYDRNASTYKDLMILQIEARDRIIKTVMDGHDRDRESFREVIRDVRQK